MYGGLFSYVKVSIACWCRGRNRKDTSASLFWFGVWTQIGSAVGAGIAFGIVNYTDTFEPYHVVC